MKWNKPVITCPNIPECFKNLNEMEKHEFQTIPRRVQPPEKKYKIAEETANAYLAKQRLNDIVADDRINLTNDKQPSEQDIKEYMKLHTGVSYYFARNELRQKARITLGAAPDGFASWSDYWKSVDLPVEPFKFITK